MSIPDLINGSFELTGGLLCWANVRRLLRDRKVQGVDWRVSAFFSAWGFWNLFYYPSLSQWASFVGGLAIVVANTAWVVLALRFIKLQKETEDAVDWSEHMRHKAFNPSCRFCRSASLPEIPAHTYKCECELCTDPRTDHS